MSACFKKKARSFRRDNCEFPSKTTDKIDAHNAKHASQIKLTDESILTASSFPKYRIEDLLEMHAAIEPETVISIEHGEKIRVAKRVPANADPDKSRIPLGRISVSTGIPLKMPL
jgi:hypothetical protein